MPLTAIRRATAVSVATAALAVPVGMTAEPVAAAKYPAKVEKAFMKGCLASARKQQVPQDQARKICRRTYQCLQRQLTLKQFIALSLATKKGKKNPPHKKVLLRCAAEAAS